MWQHIGVLLTLCGLGAAISDMTHICDDIRLGDVVPNPYDCQSYFVCGPVPIVNFCDAGLHFDAHRKVCNWPERANCNFIVIEAVDNASETTPPTTESLTSSTAATNTDSSTNTTPSFSEWSSKLNPTFMAVDVATGHTIDPMDQYDPQHIACRHFGAYFMPHPRSCSKYFLCAYGYLHMHECGRGTHWNYKRQQCELSVLAQCYSETVQNVSEEKPISQSIFCYGRYQNTEGTSWLPIDGGNNNGPTAIETPMNTDNWHTTDPDDTPTATPTTTAIPDSTTTTTTTTTTITTTTTFTPTSTVTADPTTIAAVAISSEALPRPLTTARADIAILECPSNRQAYLSHPQDCSKYYICIVGMPVLTSCPEGYFWDQKAEFCDLSKNVQCNQSQ